MMKKNKKNLISVSTFIAVTLLFTLTLLIGCSTDGGTGKPVATTEGPAITYPPTTTIPPVELPEKLLGTFENADYYINVSNEWIEVLTKAGKRSTWYIPQTFAGGADGNEIEITNSKGTQLSKIVFGPPIPTDTITATITIGDTKYENMKKGEYIPDPPDPPAKPNAVAVDDNDNSIKVSWSADEAGLLYKVYQLNSDASVNSNDDSDWSEVTDGPINASSYVVSNLAYGDIDGTSVTPIKYYFKISATLKYTENGIQKAFESGKSAASNGINTNKPLWVDAQGDDRIIFVDGTPTIGGKDTNPGTRTQPLATLNKGLEVLKNDPFKSSIMIANNSVVKDYNEKIVIDFTNKPVVIDGGYLSSSPIGNIVTTVIANLPKIAQDVIASIGINDLGAWTKFNKKLDIPQIIKDVTKGNVDLEAYVGTIIDPIINNLPGSIPIINIDLKAIVSANLRPAKIVSLLNIEYGFNTGVAEDPALTDVSNDRTATITIKPGCNVVLIDMKIGGTRSKSGSTINSYGIINQGNLTLKNTQVTGWDSNDNKELITNSYGILNEHITGKRKPKLTVYSGSITGVSSDLFGLFENDPVGFKGSAYGIYNKGGDVIVGTASATEANGKTTKVYGAYLKAKYSGTTANSNDTYAILNETGDLKVKAVDKSADNTVIAGMSGIPFLGAATVGSSAFGIKNMSTATIENGAIYGLTSISGNEGGAGKDTYALWNGGTVSIKAGIIRGRADISYFNKPPVTKSLFKGTGTPVFKKLATSAKAAKIQDEPPFPIIYDLLNNTLKNTPLGMDLDTILGFITSGENSTVQTIASYLEYATGSKNLWENPSSASFTWE